MDSVLTVKLQNYQPDSRVAQLIHDTQILLLVGPTGAGKDSIKEKLLAAGGYHHIISHTTRLPRINHGIIEKDGVDYHFINKDQAEQMLDQKAFIEAKMYSDNLYGTSVAEIQAALDEGKVAMTDIEVQGVAEYKALDAGVIAVFLLPPDFQTWQARLQRRYGDVVDAADSRLRIETALRELDELSNTYYYVPVINEDLETTYNQIQSIVASADHTSIDEPAARQVAQKLSADIKAYLEKTSS